MVEQFLRKHAKVARGAWNTYVRRRGQIYDSREWWDESFYTEGVSDRQTISQKKNQISARYHYTSVELQILKHIFNYDIEIEGSTVLDIGSGAGHWIDFYKSLGSSKTIALDVSLEAVNYLKAKYDGRLDVTIRHGKASDLIAEFDWRFNIVNAIGVMFHVVDDSEWTDTVQKIAGVMKQNGLLVVGGHFGLFDGLNVQIDRNGIVNKRLRSKRRWNTVLRKAGFKNTWIYRNSAYLWINDPLPENHILVATK